MILAEPLLSVALFTGFVSLMTGFAIGRLTLPESRGVYAKPWR
jgi:hypothetical protein